MGRLGRSDFDDDEGIEPVDCRRDFLRGAGVFMDLEAILRIFVAVVRVLLCLGDGVSSCVESVTFPSSPLFAMSSNFHHLSAFFLLNGKDLDFEEDSSFLEGTLSMDALLLARRFGATSSESIKAFLCGIRNEGSEELRCWVKSGRFTLLGGFRSSVFRGPSKMLSSDVCRVGGGNGPKIFTTCAILS